MSILDQAKLAAAPYMLAIKVAVLIGLLGFGVWLGFRLDPDTDCGQLDAETAAELATLRTANAEYAEADRLRAIEQDKAAAEQDERDKQAELERRALKLKADALAQKLRANELARQAAKDNPKCAELMELQVCETIPLP